MCQSLAKSALILLVMSDRTDTFRELRHETGVKKNLQESDALVYYFYITSMYLVLNKCRLACALQITCVKRFQKIN